jgi:hypothetical protein
MADTKKILPYVVFGVPIAIGLYFVYKAIKNKMRKGLDAPMNFDPKQNSEVVKNNSGGVTPKIAELFPLRKGSKGGKVKELQKAILLYDDTLLGKYRDDGDFGTITSNALQTILGKTSADSQDDIDAIVKKANEKKQSAETQAFLQTTYSNSIKLANKLLDALDTNKNLDFYAIAPSDGIYEEYTSDGRVLAPKSVSYTIGSKISTKGYTKEFVSPEGNIRLYFENMKPKRSLYFSPNAFEVK